MSFAPPNPPTEKPKDPLALLEATRNELAILERSLAGYSLLSRAYDQQVNGVPEGERKVGIPQFRHSGTIDGRNVVECIPELSKAPANFIPVVLSVFCNVHAGDTMTAARQALRFLKSLVATLEMALGPAAQSPPAMMSAVTSAGEDHTQAAEDEDEEFEPIREVAEDKEDDEVEEALPSPPRRFCKARKAQG